MWQSRARGLHAIDLDGRSFVLAVDGSLFDGEPAVVTGAHELMQPDAADHELARVVAPADFLRHAELRVIDHQLVASVGGRNSLCAALVADHRAPIG